MRRKVSQTWKIRCVSKCDLKTGEAFISPTFCFPGGKEKFYLKLYLQGFTEFSKDDISVHLYSLYGKKITIYWTISIFNIDDRTKDISRSGNNDLNNKYLLGSLLISRKIFEDEKYYFLANDELMLSCVVCEAGVDADKGETFPTVERHSISVVRKASLKWTISNFSKKYGRTLLSPEFGISGMKEKFFLSLNFKGKMEKQQYISVFLSCDADEEVSLSMTISIVNICDRKKDFIKSVSVKRKFRTCYGFEQFISREDLFSINSHLLTDDELTLTCVVNVTEHIIDEEYVDGDKNSVSNADVDAGINVFNNSRANTDENTDSEMQAWRILVANKDFADVLLKTTDMKSSPSKFLLKAGAAVFASALRDLKTDAKGSNFKEDIIEDFLISIYPDVCHHFDNTDFKLKLLAAAHTNNIPGLRKECVKYLTVNICEANVFAILVKAQCLGDQELYAKCLDYIRQELFSDSFLLTWKQKLFPIPKMIELTAECSDKKNNVRKYKLLSVSRSSCVMGLIACLIWGAIYFSI